MTNYVNMTDLQEAHVLHLALPDSLDMVEFDRMQEQILHTVSGKTGESWILDLANVHYMGSAMLGLMVNLRHRIRSGNGVLVLCNCSDRLLGILRASSMHKLFAIARNTDDALKMTRL